MKNNLRNSRNKLSTLSMVFINAASACVYDSADLQTMMIGIGDARSDSDDGSEGLDDGGDVPIDATVEARSARRSLLNRLQDRARGRNQDIWANATQEEFIEAGRLERASSVPTDRQWRSSLGRLRGEEAPTREQIDALSDIENLATGHLFVRWNSLHSTPAEIKGIGFVRRGRGNREIWGDYLRERGEAFRRVYGISENSEIIFRSELIRGDVTRLRFTRELQGIPVTGQFLDIEVTTARSPLGAGVLWRIQGNWDRSLHPRLPAIERAHWLSESQVRPLVSDIQSESPPRLEFWCSSRCRPVFSVWAGQHDIVQIDAISGEILGRNSTIQNLGPLTINGYPPGATTATPVAFRGANWLNNYTNAYEGASSMADGSHTSALNSPVLIGFEGPRASGIYPIGRVVKATTGRANEVSTPPRIQWTPSSQASRNFASAWDSFPSTYPRSTQMIWGALTYFQFVSRDLLWADVPETLNFEIVTNSNPAGVFGNQYGTGGSVPGTGQANSAMIYTSVYEGGADTIADPTSGLWSLGHEHGHALLACNSELNNSCQSVAPHGTPASHPSRMLGSAWRGEMNRNTEETLANVFGSVLTQYRSNWPGGWNPEMFFETYDSATDSFGTATQEIANNSEGSTTTDCRVHGCPSGFACLLPGGGAFSPDGVSGLCVRSCSVLGDDDPSPCRGNAGEYRGLTCAATYRAATPALEARPGWIVNDSPRPNGICMSNHLTEPVVSMPYIRASLSLGWSYGLEGLLESIWGRSENGSRDFIHGTDSYAERATNDYSYNRYEWTRAFRSVVRDVSGGPSFTYYDDAPDRPSRAAPVALDGNQPLAIWQKTHLIHHFH